MNHSGCTHQLDYLLKQHENNYIGRVLQIPTVVVSGDSVNDVESKIKDATLAYLRTFESEHQDALDGKLKPILETPQNGIVLETKQFEVKC